MQGRKGTHEWQPFVGFESSRGGTGLRTGFSLAANEHAEMGLLLQQRDGVGGLTDYGLELIGQILW